MCTRPCCMPQLIRRRLADEEAGETVKVQLQSCCYLACKVLMSTNSFPARSCHTHDLSSARKQLRVRRQARTSNLAKRQLDFSVSRQPEYSSICSVLLPVQTLHVRDSSQILHQKRIFTRHESFFNERRIYASLLCHES